MKPLKGLIASVCLTAVFTTCAYAESMRVSVPFSFRVGDTVMPAGAYIANTDYARSVVHFQALTSAEQCFIPVMMREVNTPGPLGKLVFKRYASGAYLQAVSPASGFNYRLFPSARERESASRESAKRVVIAELRQR